MLDYEIIKAFINKLENDQAPVPDENREIARTAYDEGRHIYSIDFEVGFYGTVTVRVLVQWGLMEKLLLNKDRMVRWDADSADALHIYLKLPNQPDVEYTTVLFKDDVRRIHPSDSPFPADESVEDIWVKLYNRGVWKM